MAAGRLTRTVGIVACGRAAHTIGVLAVWGILARPWTQIELGIFLALWTATSSLVPLFLLGLPTALLYFHPRTGLRGQRLLIAQVGGLLLVAGAILFAGMVSFGPALLQRWRPEDLGEVAEIRRYLLAFAPYLFALVAGGSVEATLVAAGRPAHQAALAVAGAAGLVAVAATVAACNASVVQALYGFSAVGVTRLLTGLMLVARCLPGTQDSSNGVRSLGELLRYAMPIWLADGVGSLSRYVDRLVVLGFFTAATFPLYQFGAIEVPIGLLLSAVVTVLVPEVSRLYANRQLAAIGSLWRQAVGRLALIVLPLWAYLFFFAGPLITLYATARYGPAVWVFRVFLLALPLRCAVYNPLLVGMGKARWAFWGSVGDLVVNAGLSVLLVQMLLTRGSEWAYLGAAVATVTATYLQVGFLVGAVAFHLRWRLQDLLPWWRLLRVGGWATGAAGLAWWLTRSLSTPALVLGWGTAAFTALICLGLLLDPPDRQELRYVLHSLGRHRHGA